MEKVHETIYLWLRRKDWTQKHFPWRRYSLWKYIWEKVRWENIKKNVKRKIKKSKDKRSHDTTDRHKLDYRVLWKRVSCFMERCDRLLQVTVGKYIQNQTQKNPIKFGALIAIESRLKTAYSFSRQHNVRLAACFFSKWFLLRFLG